MRNLASGGQGRFLKKLPLDPAKTFYYFNPHLSPLFDALICLETWENYHSL
jgi:hypothetical protein